MGEDSHRAGELSYAHILGGSFESSDVALRLGIPVGDFESEGDGLGVDPVGAADRGRVFEFPGAALEDLGETLQIFFYDLGGLTNQEGLRGVDYVVGGEAVVEPAGFGADELGNGGGEGDDVVADFGFDLVDAFEAEVGEFADGFGGGLGNLAGGREGFGGGDFDGQPGAEAVFVAPDAGHLGAGVARDQGLSPGSGLRILNARRGVRLGRGRC